MNLFTIGHMIGPPVYAGLFYWLRDADNSDGSDSAKHDWGAGKSGHSACAQFESPPNAALIADRLEADIQCIQLSQFD